MKKYILLLIIPFLSFGQNAKTEIFINNAEEAYDKELFSESANYYTKAINSADNRYDLAYCYFGRAEAYFELAIEKDDTKFWEKSINDCKQTRRQGIEEFNADVVDLLSEICEELKWLCEDGKSCKLYQLHCD